MLSASHNPVEWNALKFAKSDAARSAIQSGRGANCK